jgi:PAS domain S-box-containing protein
MRLNLPMPLDASEQALEEVFRHTPVGVVLIDLHGTILDANHAYCALLGRERDAIVGLRVRDFVHPTEQDDTERGLARLRDGEIEHAQHTRRYLACDGSVVTTRVTVSLVHSKDQEPICGIAFVEDIGERLAMESALRESEHRYRQVVEDQTELIVRCLPDGTRLFVNDAYCRYNETPAAELLGTSFFPCIVEEERDLIHAKFASLTPQQPVLTDVHRIIDPRGAIRWHEWTDRGFFDDAGTLVEVQAVGRDITEERESQELLRRSEESFRMLYGSLPVAVWETDFSGVLQEIRRRGLDSPGKLIESVDRDPAIFHELARESRFVRANRAALTLTGAADPQGVLDWLRAHYTFEAARAYARGAAAVILGEEEVVDVELPLRTADGRRIDLLQRLAKTPTWPDEPHIIAIALDVTGRKQTERTLAQEREAMTRADKMISLGILVAGVAHEINNPNHAILLNTPLLRDAWKAIAPIVDEHAAGHAAGHGPLRVAGLPWDEMRTEAASMIDDIEHAAERVRGIVTELHGFARGHDSGAHQPLLLNDAVKSSLRLLGNHIRKATTAFSVALVHDLPPVIGNPQRLEQVIINLVLNACQALETTEAMISIETGCTPTHVFVRVADGGRGIRKEDLAMIKDPFFTTKRAEGGSGLGLAVSERIVQEHGGELTFDSAPGRGTVATLSLPVGER